MLPGAGGHLLTAMGPALSLRFAVACWEYIAVVDPQQHNQLQINVGQLAVIHSVGA